MAFFSKEACLMVQSAIVIDENDNVATALRDLDAGNSIRLDLGDRTADAILLDRIPFGHKFALLDIEPGEPIIKYGEVIGLATSRIAKGEHTHVHNVEGQKGRGDRP
jgi:altronate dehydratase small subunit